MKKSGISRRQFLKGAAASAASMAAMGLIGNTPISAAEGTTSEGAKYEVYHTQVLVIGAGASAMWSIQHMLPHGKQIMIVDKGPFRHSGASGMSWDCQFLWPDNVAGYQFPLMDPNIFKKACDYLVNESYHPLVDLINHGHLIPNRLEDGTISPYRSSKGAISVLFRREMDEMFAKCVTVMDQVMITGFLVNDGRCLGAMGIHLPTGTFRVIRADAVINASNTAMIFRGRHSMGYKGVAPDDCTGDADMAAFRQGLAIGESEFSQYDISAIEPRDLAHCFGGVIMGDSSEPGTLYDGEKQPLIPNDGTYYNNYSISKLVARKVYEEGKGTPNGGIYLHFGENNPSYNCNRNVALSAQFGVDPYNGFVEAMPEMYEHGGSPVIDDTMMTEWEGLFEARGAGAMGCLGGLLSFHNKLYSSYTGKCVVDYLDKAAPVDAKTIDWTPVEEEYTRVHELLTRKVSGGKRPHEIRKMIQDAGGRGFDVYRPTAWMEEAVAELERIRKEEMPLQVCADASTTYNTDWKFAIENINLLDSAEMSIKASLLREETRNAYYRPEFPTVDNENWNCMLTCRLVDGKMVFEKRAIPELKA